MKNFMQQMDGNRLVESFSDLLFDFQALTTTKTSRIEQLKDEFPLKYGSTQLYFASFLRLRPPPPP